MQNKAQLRRPEQTKQVSHNQLSSAQRTTVSTLGLTSFPSDSMSARYRCCTYR
uniref:Uncharacterized protein n=1 Tax=Anguilla anguilla TaxID=7936 RepID=A0A0E9W903_ANGAN